jgi:hypothetical protein
MPLVTIDAYNRLVANRPYKFSGDEVNYRKADTDHTCENCLHLYKRAWDGYGVCEILRDGEGENEEPIKPDWVCDFNTVDGESFPLLESDDKDR